MLKISNFEIIGWEHAIRGMRNPMNSWEKSDSGYCQHDLLRDCATCVHRSSNYPACFSRFELGRNDFDLMTRLRNAGTDHRKFMRMIAVYVDLTGPLYWWKEFDTYKVGTVCNSCSTMHKIQAKEFTLDDFSHEHLDYAVRAEVRSTAILEATIDILNYWREKFLEYDNDLKTCSLSPEAKKMRTADRKHAWWQMIQLLPSSYNQKRTIMLNYEVLANIYKSRRNHKLDEWHTFCDWIENLPYSELITGPSLKDMPICNEIMEEAKRRVYEELNTQHKEDNIGRNDGLNKNYGGQED